MTIDHTVPPVAWDEDGEPQVLEVVALEDGGVEVRAGGREEPVLTLRHTDDVERLAKVLRQAGDRWRELACLAEPVVLSAREDGAWEAQSGILAVRRIPDERAIINGRPFGKHRLKHYRWSDEKHRQLIGVPEGMTLREVTEEARHDIWLRRPVPRLYRVLLASEREARATPA